MLPGPTLIMKAPGCKKPVKFSTIASGNTFGAVFWTDGKREAPMLPDEPWLRKAPGEGVLFWSDECEQIGEIDHGWSDEEGQGEDPRQWEDLDWAEEPSETDYVEAIASGMGDTPEKLRYLRMRLWWKGNDRIRTGETAELPAAHLDNLRALKELLLETEPDGRLMKAEVCRELGEFENARCLLNSAFPKGYADSAAVIRGLCDQGSRTVAVLADDR